VSIFKQIPLPIISIILFVFCSYRLKLLITTLPRFNLILEATTIILGYFNAFLAIGFYFNVIKTYPFLLFLIQAVFFLFGMVSGVVYSYLKGTYENKILWRDKFKKMAFLTALLVIMLVIIYTIKYFENYN
jgi:hypothetical protein